MAKFLPVIGEIFTTVESAAKLVGAGVVAPFDSEKSKQLFKGAGDAWVDYKDNNAIALAFQGRGKDLGQKSVGFAEGLPVVGHGIGVGRYIAGDREGGDRRMKQASRSTAVVAAAVLTGGAAGAVACGAAAVGAGLATDVVTTGVDYAVHGEYRPSGVVAGVTEAYKTGDPNKVVDVGLIPVADFVAGAIAGRNAAAGAAEADVMANSRSSITSAASEAAAGGGRGPILGAAAAVEIEAEAGDGLRPIPEDPIQRIGSRIYDDPTFGEVLSEYGTANPNFIATWEPQNQILTLYMEEERLRPFETAMEGYDDAEVIQPRSFPDVHRNVHRYCGETPQIAGLHTHVRIYAEQEATIRHVLGLVLGEGNDVISNFIEALLNSFDSGSE